VDFDSVTTAGTYTLSVTTPIAASSSRDGPNYVPNALRGAPGHLNDQNAKVYFTPSFDKKDNAGPLTPTGAILDASGGWWDAGDYLKFVETHSYTVAMMLVGVRDFPNQLDAGSSSSNYTAEAQFGLDWLQKMWADGTKTLYYQVGVGSGGRAYAAITISGASLRPMTTSQIATPCTSTSAIARSLSTPEEPAHKSVQTSPDAWPPTSPCVTKFLP